MSVDTRLREAAGRAALDTGRGLDLPSSRADLERTYVRRRRSRAAGAVLSLGVLVAGLALGGAVLRGAAPDRSTPPVDGPCTTCTPAAHLRASVGSTDGLVERRQSTSTGYGSGTAASDLLVLDYAMAGPWSTDTDSRRLTAADHLAWLVAQPGVEATPVVADRVGGRDGLRTTITVKRDGQTLVSTRQPLPGPDRAAADRDRVVAMHAGETWTVWMLDMPDGSVAAVLRPARDAATTIVQDDLLSSLTWVSG